MQSRLINSSSSDSSSPLVDGEAPPSIHMLVGEAAAFLRCSKSFLNKKRLDGSGPPYIKLGKKILYDQKDLVLWTASKKRQRTV
jgi:hypothetical protein